MEAEILTIGDELLLGLVVDTNSAWLGKKLSEIGTLVKFKTTVGDHSESIEDAIRRALDRVDLVITTGGLGSTVDDATKRAVARVFKSKLVLDEKVLKAIETHFEARSIPMPVLSTQQALVPQGATVLPNPLGTAPGLLFKRGEKMLLALPGIPYEMERIFEESALSMLRRRRPEQTVLRSTIRTTAIPESDIAGMLSPVLKGARRAKVAFIPTPTGIDLRITARAQYQELARKELRNIEEEICSRLGEAVYGRDEETLEQVVGYLLTMKKLTVSVAESCTGGLITDRLTDVPGSSRYFEGGVVSYSDELKTKGLKVSRSTLKKRGAVSSQTAIEMAQGVRNLCGTDLGISVTGIAGPTGGSQEKPVGLVYIALSTQDSTQFEEHRFVGSRRPVKESAAQAALDMLRRYLLHI